MELFETVLNPASIYNMLFFSVKAALEYPTLEQLKEHNPAMYSQWKLLSSQASFDNEEENYRMYAIKYPEFSKIVAIAYATFYFDDGKIKRSFKAIKNEDEAIIIENFMEVLHQKSIDGQLSTPQTLDNLCGHNIIAFDIPLLIKRFMVHVDKFEKKKLPYMLRHHLSTKPWDSNIVDTQQVWKFSGSQYASLSLISNFLSLKTTVDLLSNNELSEYYWNNFQNNPAETLTFVELQAVNQTNVVIGLINRLRTYGS